MTVSYSTNLGLALPAQGDWAGSWGTNQNQFITQYLDAAIAGAQVISGSQTAVTLSTTNGIPLSQAGAGATGSAQYAVINCTGNPASMLTITAPLTDKTYVIINATSTNQAVKIVGVGPTTGVTVAAARAAMVAWNGADFVLVATTDASKLTGVLDVANGGTGQVTAQAAINALAGAVTSGQYLRGNGTNVVMSTIQAADVPTLNQNTTGNALTATTATNVSGGTVSATSGTFNNYVRVLTASPNMFVTDTAAGTGSLGKYNFEDVSYTLQGYIGYDSAAPTVLAIQNNKAGGITLNGVPAVTTTGAQTLTNKTLTSPVLSGTPTAPTASQGTSTTQVATTQFVQQALPGTTAESIGSYMLATYAGPNVVNFGDTVVSSFLSPYLKPVNLSATSVGTAVNGTWRCLGQVVTYGNNPGPYSTSQIQNGSTLWVRVS